MNIQEFNAELEKINKNSWGYGNEILYCMAQNSHDLTDKDKLAGAIWLIGRAYAASPQRRSYGTMNDNPLNYIKTDGNRASKCPIWPVRTQNDGREGFFDDIADNIIANLDFIGWMDCLSDFSAPYKYNQSNEDIDALTKSIIAVLRFNILLSEALEKFDEVPKNNRFGNYKVYCSNHISFSSKFMHVYFPNSVFIIDNFAREGGKQLFGGDHSQKKRGLYTPKNAYENPFDKTVYAEFGNEDFSNLNNRITKDPAIKKIINEYNKRNRQLSTTSGDNSTVKDYIEHCIRSYLLGCYIKNKARIKPINQIKYNNPVSIFSMPRLTDTILLNIKEPLSGKLWDYFKSVEKVFKVKYIKKHIN